MFEGVQSDSEKDRVLLGLLDLVERDGSQSQRRLAGELGIALGLVNAYLKRCVTKGYVKIKAVPRKRYAYYLTPKGFTEKSRLTVDYFSSSFSFFRQAKADCSATLKIAMDNGCRTIALLGISDLAEIAIICAMDTGIKVGAVVDPEFKGCLFVGTPVVDSIESVVDKVDVAIVTDLKTAQLTADAAVAVFGVGRVLAPAFLNVRAASGRRGAR
jgi:Winged helix-turn-helix DNA-binding